jgi:hypothetical protein
MNKDAVLSSVLQNKIVDQCERLQLQSAGISKYMAEVLQGKNQKAVVILPLFSTKCLLLG